MYFSWTKEKIPSIGVNFNLDSIIYEAYALEAVNRQLEGFLDKDKKSWKSIVSLRLLKGFTKNVVVVEGHI